MLPYTPRHLIYRTHDTRGNVEKSDATHETLRRPTVYCEKGQVVRTYNNIEWPIQNHYSRYCEGVKEEDVGRQHMGVVTK